MLTATSDTKPRVRTRGRGASLKTTELSDTSVFAEETAFQPAHLLDSLLSIRAGEDLPSMSRSFDSLDAFCCRHLRKVLELYATIIAHQSGSQHGPGVISGMVVLVDTKSELNRDKGVSFPT